MSDGSRENNGVAAEEPQPIAEENGGPHDD